MPNDQKTEVMGVTAFKPPPEINFCGNLSEVWKRWKQRYDLYVLATSTNTLPNEQQVAIGIELYNTFNLSATVKVNEVIDQFEIYCNPRKIIVYERFKFFNAKQKPDQSIGEYIIELQTLSTSCEFMEKNNLCRDRLIVGLLDIGLQERLLRESNLTLEKDAEFCGTAEASRQQANAIQGQSSQTRTNSVERVDAEKAKEVSNNSNKSWFKNVIVSFRDTQVNVNFKLDSGAVVQRQTSYLSIQLNKTKTVLVSFGDQRIKPEGEVVLDCTINNKSERHKIKFLIVNISNAIPILGLDACRLLKLISRIDTVTLENVEGKVCLKRLQLKKGAIPINIKNDNINICNENVVLPLGLTPSININKQIDFGNVSNCEQTFIDPFLPSNALIPPEPKKRKIDTLNPSTSLYQLVLNNRQMIDVPKNWFRSNEIAPIDIAFHTLSTFKSNYSRYIEKQLIIKNDSKIILLINNNIVTPHEIGLKNSQQKNLIEFKSLFNEFDKIKCCQGAFSSTENKDIRASYGPQYIESCGQWRHIQCSSVIKDDR
ncbi:hypothetical protein ACI65C_012021 [Semiaphis heraclei]